MTVAELIQRLRACAPDHEVVVPCMGCGESEAEATLVEEFAEGVELIMCAACAKPHKERDPR